MIILKLKVQTCWYGSSIFSPNLTLSFIYHSKRTYRLLFSKEQLDGAGVELLKLYKMIESQVPSRLYTEAWKKRAHWVGTQVTEETVESLANAESFLQTHRPVRK